MNAVVQATPFSPSSPYLAGLLSAVIPDLQMVNSTNDEPWPELKRIVYRVHAHKCGHGNFADIKTLVYCNGRWTAALESYVTKVINECPNCLTTAAPLPSRRVAISSVNRSFNECV